MQGYLLTVISGVSVFVVGQFMLRLVVEPIVEFKKLIGGVSHLFLSNQPKIISANCSNDLCIEMKSLSARLLSSMRSIPLYAIVATVFGLPKAKNVIEAVRNINLVSSSAMAMLGDEKKQHRVREINEAMKSIKHSLRVAVSYS